ncbi:MAG: polyphosphate kinase 1 [Planctomycetota bacterium]|jgi:polyphosphate kinase
MADQEPRFFNRELSWLEFNQRVLDEARDANIPILERIRFLAITASNLDEFFMVRVGGLQTIVGSHSHKRDPAGMTPAEQLQAIRERTQQLTRDQYACYVEELEPQFDKAGLKRLRPVELNEQQARVMQQVFRDEIVSLLAPLAVQTPGDFPLLINRTLSICLRLERPSADNPDETETRYAVIPFGRVPLRFVTLPSEGSYSFVLLEEVVQHFASEFFPEETVCECITFRITRNADMAIREDLASDLLSEMEDLLVARRESDCVRLEIADGASDELTGFLQECLELSNDEVYRIPGPLDLTPFFQLADAGSGDENRYASWPPRQSPIVDPQESMFDTIARQDVLLYHPYESFDPVVRFVNEAADDPDVLAIKQTLYRTSRNSPIVSALARAAEKGKHVTAIVELKARFDEERNIEWARALEQAGVQVFYGVKGLKTHAKICIVVRREPQGIQRYVHFGTGNYNDATARIYSDASLMTCDEELGADAISFFNSVTGFSLPQPLTKIAAAPLTLREKIEEMVEAEIEFKKQKQYAEITAKVNSLVCPRMIELLYRASRAGVKVRLNIRGICCLRPGVKGLSDNIEVVSVVDRFLEHARILHFRHGGDQHVFISSADWMPRNLDRRVELLVPVDDAASKHKLITALECYFTDTVKGRSLQPNGRYTMLTKTSQSLTVPSQEWLYQQTCSEVEQAERSRQVVLEAIRAPGSD